MSDTTAAPSPVREGINKFFTMGTVGTFAGSVAALTLVVNVLYDVMGVGSKPLTLGIALAMSIGTCLWSTSAKGRQLVGVTCIAVINGLLIYGTAYGVDMSVISSADVDEAVHTAPVAEPPPAEVPENGESEDPPPPPPKELDRPRIDVRQEGPFGNRRVLQPIRLEPVKPGGG